MGADESDSTLERLMMTLQELLKPVGKYLWHTLRIDFRQDATIYFSFGLAYMFVLSIMLFIMCSNHRGQPTRGVLDMCLPTRTATSGSGVARHHQPVAVEQQEIKKES